MRPSLLLAAALTFTGPVVSPAAQPLTSGWREASLVPINHLAHPRRRGQVPPPAGRPNAKTASVKPSAVVAATPTPTPRPVATPAPTPTPLPSAAPSAAPLPQAIEVEQDEVVRPRFTLGAFLPIPGGGATPTQPAPILGLSLWQGTWGVSAETMLVGPAYVAGRTTPYIQPNTPLTDVLLMQRSLSDPYDRTKPDAPARFHGEWWLGYRGLGLADLNFAVAGGGMVVPLGLRDLTFSGRVLGGIAPSGAFCADGRLGVAVRAGILEAELGVRDFYLVVAGQPTLNLWGPQANVGIRF